jgi:SHS family lactate transporter-like MFS transporter
MADTEHGQLQQQTLETQTVQDERMGIARYLATRLSTLKPPLNQAPNPFSALLLLNKQQWLFVSVSCPGLLSPSNQREQFTYAL